MMGLRDNLRKIDDSCRTLFKRLASDQGGQGTVEYIILLAVVVVGAAQIARQVVSLLDKAALRIGADLERDLKTGRAPLDVWQN